jgi:general secretion pathway protein D
MQQDETTVMRRVNYREAASVIINAETGIVTVRATSRQHEKIQEFIDHVSSSARRQVMIEATIVEVDLNDTYQQGIDWSRTRADGSGFALKSTTATNTVNQSTPFLLSYLNKKNPLDINIALSLLEQFGSVKVLSSPRLSVLNNQSALLKVVENKVYFTVKADVASATVSGAQPTKAVTTTPQSVSVGLVMSVTPQISESNSITLNVRPSITSISNYVIDPSPELRDSSGQRIDNRIPEIKTREMESVMRIEDGEVAVLGGLMQERTEYNTGRVPGAGAIPFFGEIFTSRNNLVGKSELVIFLRPVVIRDPSVNGDYAKLRASLPGEQFFTPPATGIPFGIGSGGGSTQP